MMLKIDFRFFENLQNFHFVIFFIFWQILYRRETPYVIMFLCKCRLNNTVNRSVRRDAEIAEAHLRGAEVRALQAENESARLLKSTQFLESEVLHPPEIRPPKQGGSESSFSQKTLKIKNAKMSF